MSVGLEIDDETLREACERMTILLIGQKEYDRFVQERGPEWTERLIRGYADTIRRAWQVASDMGISFGD